MQVPEGVPEVCPVWNSIKPKQVEEAFAQYVQSESLHDLPEFRNWFLPTDLLKQVEYKASEISMSKVLVSDQQKKEQLDLLMTETVDSYFTDTMRALWARRIEDAAYLLMGARKVEPSKALLALTVAKALENESRPASGIPFCARLLGKALRLPQNEQSGGDDDSQAGKGGILIS